MLTDRDYDRITRTATSDKVLYLHIKLKQGLRTEKQGPRRKEWQT